MTAMRPTKDRSLSDEIYDKLKKRLILGQYLPGDRLSMRKLADEFGTSTMSVREALKQLLVRAGHLKCGGQGLRCAQPERPRAQTCSSCAPCLKGLPCRLCTPL
jgi:DNA-binding transcriptional regulator YhcF (GntR family)